MYTYIVNSDVARRANYLVNEIKLQRIKGRAVVRVWYYRDETKKKMEKVGGGESAAGEARGDKDNRGKGDDAGIRLANAFISIRRGRVTCSPLRSISSTSFARSPPSNLLPLPFLLPSSLPPRPPHHSSFSPSLFRFCSILSSLSLARSLVTSAFTLSLPLFSVSSLVLPRFLSVCASL